MASSTPTRALVYRGPAADPGCPESIGNLLKNNNFEVTYAGPKEKVDVTPETLANVQVYVQPGGGDLDETWPMMRPYKKTIRNYVSNGGRYMGFCLGAYLAGYDPGFELLPKSADTEDEASRNNSQVRDDEGTVIQVDWTFTSGPKAGTLEKDRWMYFQDGAMLKFRGKAKNVTILGRYSKSQDIAAAISPFGKGWIGLVGPHPEADQSWYDDDDVTNPDGIKMDIALDFINATMKAGNGPSIADVMSGTTSGATHAGSAARVSVIGVLTFIIVVALTLL